MLLDGQPLESLDRGLGRALRLQVGFQDVEVDVEPFQVLLLDRGNALKDLVGVKDRLGICERVRCSGWRLLFDVGEGVGFDAEPFKVVPGRTGVTSLPSGLTWLTSRTDPTRGMVTLSPMRGTIGGSGGAGFLPDLAITQPA